MRDLAKVCTIRTITPIEGKDKIVLATFNENAYQVIVQKEFFEVGSQCVFIEADSLLPIREEFEFLRSRCFKPSLNRFLIKPMKMGGVISMAIVFPMSILPKGKYKNGEDVTDVLKIEKYEPQEDATPKKQSTLTKFMYRCPITRPVMNLIKKFKVKTQGDFPTYLLAKSDEVNIQDCSELLEKYKDLDVYATIKHEGQSVTALFQPKRSLLGKKKELGIFTMCSRNNSYTKLVGNNEAGKFGEFANRLKLKEALEKYYKEHHISLAIQGERCGPAIQKNIYQLSNTTLFIYTIKDLTHNRLLSYDEMMEVYEELFKDNDWVKMVLLRKREFKLGDYTIDDYIKLAKNYYALPFTENRLLLTKKELSRKDKKLHEGIVVRSLDQKVSFKVKDAEYAYNWSCKD